jgi:hypothetical protein
MRTICKTCTSLGMSHRVQRCEHRTPSRPRHKPVQPSRRRYRLRRYAPLSPRATRPSPSWMTPLSLPVRRTHHLQAQQLPRPMRSSTGRCTTSLHCSMRSRLHSSSSSSRHISIAYLPLPRPILLMSTIIHSRLTPPTHWHTTRSQPLSSRHTGTPHPCLQPHSPIRLHQQGESQSPISS